MIHRASRSSIKPFGTLQVPAAEPTAPLRVEADVRGALLSLGLAGLIAGCGPIMSRTPDPFAATGELIALSGGDGGAANACFRCHGMRGQGDGVAAPRLAGLDPGYLRKQLDDYATGIRRDDTMAAVAKWLDDAERQKVAAYYAAMPGGADVSVNPAPAPAIYLHGDPARGIVACAACHGTDGRGVGSGGPALSGQPRAYTLDQLRRWSRAERRNDPRGVMTAAVERLTVSEMAAIAAWLERAPASRPPDTAAASLSAAEEAGARLAASHAARHPGR